MVLRPGKAIQHKDLALGAHSAPGQWLEGRLKCTISRRGVMAALGAPGSPAIPGIDHAEGSGGSGGSAEAMLLQAGMAVKSPCLARC